MTRSVSPSSTFQVHDSEPANATKQSKQKGKSKSGRFLHDFGEVPVDGWGYLRADYTDLEDYAD